MKRVGFGMALLAICCGLFARSRHRPGPMAHPAGGRPRLVILVALDTLRADHLGCYGYGRNTSPEIDALAQQGIVFDNAFSQGNRTTVSFGSLFMGTYPVHGAYAGGQAGGPPYDGLLTRPVLGTLLHACGVRTLASVAGGDLKGGFGFNRGFDEYHDRWDFRSIHYTLPRAMHWLDEVAADSRPTFIMVHGYDMHSPYQKPLIFGSMFDPGYRGPADSICRALSVTNIYQDMYFPSVQQLWEAREAYRQHAPGIQLSPADIRHVQAAYDGAISYADLHVAELVEKVRSLGLANRTLLILIGDHGEQLLETGFLGHVLGLDDRETHVPLVMWGPGRLPAGRHVHQVVELVDVLPTIMDAFGVKLARYPGRSLLPLALGAAVHRNRSAVSMANSVRSIRTLDYRLVLAPPFERTAVYPATDGLYAASDTASRHNLLQRPDLQPLVAKLRGTLERRLPSWQPVFTGRGMRRPRSWTQAVPP